MNSQGHGGDMLNVTTCSDVETSSAMNIMSGKKNHSLNDSMLRPSSTGSLVRWSIQSNPRTEESIPDIDLEDFNQSIDDSPLRNDEQITRPATVEMVEACPNDHFLNESHFK